MSLFPEVRILAATCAFVCAALAIVGCATKSADTRPDYRVDVASDGRIVFVAMGSGGSDLYVMAPSHDSVIRFATSRDFEQTPSFDHTGTRVAYTAAKTIGGPSHIMVVPASGGKPIQITSGEFYDVDPRFSKDGKRIVFARAKRNRDYSMGGKTWDRYDIFLVNSDGSNLRQITNHDYYQAYSPDFCKSDSTIVFIADTADHSQIRFDLLEVDVGGSSSVPKRLGTATACSCSEDGNSIVFASDLAEPFNDDLYVLDLTRGIQRQVTHVKSYVTSPVFSKDGKHIIFLSDPQRSLIPELWEADVDGTNARKLAGASLFRNPTTWKSSDP